MRGLANPDSKIFSLLNKFTLLMELNVLVLLCSLPVVTIGAAQSSMHAVLLKIYRNEEKRVTGDFFAAMKSNLQNGTILWLAFLGYVGLLAGLWILAAYVIPEYVVYVVFGLLVAAVLGMLALNWALILQSRYVYTPGQCLKNALLAWMQYPGSTFVYLVSMAIPLALCVVPQVWPLFLLVGVTLSHMISTPLYSRVFDQMEGVPIQIPEL